MTIVNAIGDQGFYFQYVNNYSTYSINQKGTH